VKTTQGSQGRVRPMQIIDAAVRVIMERGLADTRISDIAERAGVSPALVLYYFDSKDKVLSEALTYANEGFYLRISREILRLPNARDQIIRLIELSCPGLDSVDPQWDDEYILWIELWVRALRDPEMAKDREALDRRWHGVITDIIRAGQQQGAFPPSDADEAALRLRALMDGMSILLVLRDTEMTPERMRDACIDFAAHLIGFEVPERTSAKS
jgi:AcrR family transcriptional regulator